jgi:hypothetical protein
MGAGANDNRPLQRHPQGVTDGCSTARSDTWRRLRPICARRGPWRAGSTTPGSAPGPQVQLGILALVRGRLEEARALLDEGRELSLATRSTRNVTLCLGVDRFDQGFAAGTRLNRREAVAAVRDPRGDGTAAS